MILPDLKIGTQLKIGFGIILLLIAVLSYTSWQQTKEIAEEATTMYNHPLAVRRALGELKADIMAMRLEFRIYAMEDDEQGRHKALLNYGLYLADAERQFLILYDRYLGPQTDIDNVHDSFKQWQVAREESKELIQIGKISKALDQIESDGNIGKVQAIMLAQIQKIDDFAKNKAYELHQNAVELNKTLNRRLGLLIAAILVLTFLIITYLMRNIRRPLAELTNATQRFKDGEKNVRSQYIAGNEFGQLSSSFNELADTIETEFKLNEQAAKLAGVMLSEDEAHRFSHALLNNLLEHTGSQMGAVYLLNEEKTSFEHFESIGMDAEGCKPFVAINFEGEFGSALSTQKIQYITDIPEDSRFTFATVSGAFKPREIITLPIVVGNETVAVISLATIKNFSKNSIRLLNTIYSTLCARMNGILVYRKVIEFTQILEQQNNELEAQKKELSAQGSELLEQNIELEMQKKQLAEVSKLKTSFLSNMSHELRTPLNSVIALSGVLNRRLAGHIPKEEYGYLDIIERNGKHLLDLINDILDISRIEAGREEIDIKNFDFYELIQEVVEMITPQANQKNIALHMHKGENTLPISTDYDKCMHILQNIVANAIKFTDEGGVEITAETKGGFIHISVIDSGIGIDKNFLPHIFDEFRQADESYTRKNSGTGLGMSIAKKYAELLGGNIDVESTRGKGSKFTLILPIKFTNNQADNETYSSKKLLAKGFARISIDREKIKTKTILLVEDSDAIVFQMKDILESQGYNIMVARNGNEALEQIAQKIPDAMILDLMMPGLDGFGVLKRIRKEEKTERLPVIILTSKYVSKEELAFLKHNNIHQLIQKGGINKEQLLDYIAQMFFPKTEEQKTSKKRPPLKPISGIPVVIVVEDNLDNMLTMKALLAGKCKIIEARDGKTVVELTKKHQPHLILMDIALPGMNGIEALADIRKDNTLQHIPVYAVTASAMTGDREDFIALGFDGYISKPIDSKTFDHFIKGFLG